MNLNRFRFLSLNENFSIDSLIRLYLSIYLVGQSIEISLDPTQNYPHLLYHQLRLYDIKLHL
jgi:hypothetical protein